MMIFFYFCTYYTESSNFDHQYGGFGSSHSLSLESILPVPAFHGHGRAKNFAANFYMFAGYDNART